MHVLPAYTLDFLMFYSKAFSEVKEFRLAFGLPIAQPLTIADEANHTALLVEELAELAVAKSRKDQADAIIDAMYVHMGRLVQQNIYQPKMSTTAVAPFFVLYQVGEQLGFPIEEIWTEIQRSNMSKVIMDADLVDNEVSLLMSKGLEVDVIKSKHYYYLKASADCDELGIKKGKILKPSCYSPASLTEIIKR